MLQDRVLYYIPTYDYDAEVSDEKEEVGTLGDLVNSHYPKKSIKTQHGSMPSSHIMFIKSIQYNTNAHQ